MHPRQQQRNEEHGENLGIDALFDVLPGHAHLAHNGKAGLVLVALADLLVVNNQGGGGNKDNAEHDADEEQAAEGQIKVVPLQNGALTLHFYSICNGQGFQALAQRLMHRHDVLLRQVKIKAAVIAHGYTQTFQAGKLLHIGNHQHHAGHNGHLHNPHGHIPRHLSRNFQLQLANLNGVPLEAAIVSTGQRLPRLQLQVGSKQAVIVLLWHKIQGVYFIVVCHAASFCRVSQQLFSGKYAGNSCIAVNLPGSRGDLLRFQRPVQGSLNFRHVGIVHPFQAAQTQRQPAVVGIAVCHCILRTDIEATGGGNHYQHHSGKNADGGKPGTVALHAVGHGGNRDEMLLFIIIALPFLQQTAQHHAAGNHHKIGSGNDHQHRHKKPSEGAQSIGNGHRHIVGTCQQRNPQEAQQIVCPGRLLPFRLAVQQLQGLGTPHLHHGAQQKHGKNNCKNHKCNPNCRPFHREGMVHLSVHHVHQSQLCQLIQCPAEKQSGGQTQSGNREILPEHHPAQGVFVHAQHIVQAELPIAAANEERIGIQQEDGGKHRNHQLTQRKNRFQLVSALEAVQRRCITESLHDVAHHHHANDCQTIGQVQLPVLPNAGPGQTDGKQSFHASSPPVWSMVNVSEIFWYICSLEHSPR